MNKKEEQQNKPMLTLSYLVKVEYAVQQMIKLGDLDRELFEKYYDEVEE